ncbi:MAG TPA: Hpt domain-containing protein [Rhodospirillales bacterium]|nr:Hpt domain-containing protein [Rhodospirillales bacterium]
MTTSSIPGLEALKGQFLDSLKKRIKAMEDASNELLNLKHDGDGQAALDVLKFETHKLRGSGGTFGFPALTRISGLLEEHLHSPQPEPEEIAGFVSQLRRAAKPSE